MSFCRIARVSGLFITCKILLSCAQSDPVAAGKAGTSHNLAHDAREWAPPLKTKQAVPKGLIWRARGKPKGVIVCLHGIQTHAAWFGPLALELNRAGWSVIAPDRRGSGVNMAAPFRKGGVSDTGQLQTDLDNQLLAARAEAGKSGRLILLGTSWGANLAGDHVARSTSPGSELIHVDGLILLAPNTALLNKNKMAAFWCLVSGKLPFDDVHYLKGQPQGNPPRKPARSGDPPSNSIEARQGLDWQTLQHDRQHGILLQRASFRTLKAGRKFQNSWSSAAPTVPVPVLVLLARHDQIMNNAAAADLYHNSQALSSGRVTIRTLDGGHALQLTEAKELAAAISSWTTTW